MNIRTTRFIWLALIFPVIPLPAAAEEFTNAIRAFLQRRVEVEKRDAGIVVGLVDEHGTSIVSFGKLDNGTDQDVNADTLFEIGSITKTFTGLLLQDMVERGEMKLNDPLAKYLPPSATVPARHGKQITLLHLATHTSGLPRFPDNLEPQFMANPMADYTLERGYDYLSRYQLTRNPGAKWEYSNTGLGLIGQAIELKTGTNYEALLLDRICRPLKMDSTRIALTPELKPRFAAGHSPTGDPMCALDFLTLKGCGAMRSSANDMLKYVSANLGLTPSSLTTPMQKTHALQLHWLNLGLMKDIVFGGKLFSHLQAANMGVTWLLDVLPARKIVFHTGGTPGFSTFAGFDPKRRRGVVVLANTTDSNIGRIGILLLDSEWQSNRRPDPARIDSAILDGYVGQYQLSPNLGLGLRSMRVCLANMNKALVVVPALVCLLILAVVLVRTASFRKRCFIVAGVLVFAGIAAGVGAVVAGRMMNAALSRPVIAIRREGNRLITASTPGTVWGELLPTSETRFTDRLTGLPVTFHRDAQGKVLRLTKQMLGNDCTFIKTSNDGPQPPQPPKAKVAIKLAPGAADACAGHYAIAWDDLDLKLAIRREGEQLAGNFTVRGRTQGDFNFAAESETNLFLPFLFLSLDQWYYNAELNFTRDSQGQVTSVTLRGPGMPACKGRKLPEPAR